ncbi:MAG: RNA pseudouridine synthase, partial [Myxococcales bacterium]|nr:RNA pseudouridine synthase [Myxococcales bacterium]
VLFEDPHLLVLDKPSGVPTQPLRPGEGGTLLGAAVARAPAIAAAGPPLEGGLVHRLDVGTSGVVVFAKNAAQRMHLRDDFNHHRIEKRYLALARGTLPDAAVAEGPIGPGGPDRVRVGPGGQPARTEVEVLARFEDGLLWVEARTSTGRRHQVRAHLADLGAPIVGDPVYGAGPEPLLARLGLHAAAVTLADGRRFEAPVRGALAEVLDGLRKRA